MDLIVSTATFHWILDHDAALPAPLRRAAPRRAPGGPVRRRGQHRRAPWRRPTRWRAGAPYAAAPRRHAATAGYFAGPEETVARLEGAGFEEAHAGLEDADPRSTRSTRPPTSSPRSCCATTWSGSRTTCAGRSPGRSRRCAPTTPGGWCWTTCGSTWRRGGRRWSARGPGNPPRRRMGGPAPVWLLRKRTKEDFAALAVRVQPRLRQVGDGPLSPLRGKSNPRGAGSGSARPVLRRRSSAVLAALDRLPPVAVARGTTRPSPRGRPRRRAAAPSPGARSLVGVEGVAAVVAGAVGRRGG